MATPSLAMIPSAYADSKVYSVLPNNGDGDFTFNRDSSATRVGQNGLIQTVGYFGNDLVTNGDFATDSDWTKGSSWTISGGTANSNGTANDALNQSLSIPTGTLRIKFDVTARTQGSVRLFIDKPVFTELIEASAISSYEVDVVTTSNAGLIWFYSTSNFIGSIDNVSVQQILGDQPRLNYDISNGVVQSCPSLLLEPASTNTITYSEDFSNGWSYFDSSIVANVLISPSGVLNASKFIEGNGSSIKRIVNSTQSIVSGNSYTFSIFAKKGERDFITLTNYTGTADATTTFNLTIGTITSGVGSIESFENDWFKCTRSFTATATVTSQFIVQAFINNGSGIFYQGDGTSGIYIWGAQFEALSYPTSYIPTNGASQTRAAETCGDAGTVSTFNSTEGTIYFEGSTLANDGTNRFISLTDGSNDNRVLFGYRAISNQIFARIEGNNSASVDLTTVLSNTEINAKIAISYDSSYNYKMFVNGFLVDSGVGTDSIVGLDRLDFTNASGTENFYGNTKDIRVYNEALTDAQLQTLTTL